MFKIVLFSLLLLIVPFLGILFYWLLTKVRIDIKNRRDQREFKRNVMELIHAQFLLHPMDIDTSNEVLEVKMPDLDKVIQEINLKAEKHV